MRVAILLLALLSFGTANNVARAAQPDNCKICRDQHRACVQAHSKAACTMEYDMCMKQCRKK
jgi:hypothetical protein